MGTRYYAFQSFISKDCSREAEVYMMAADAGEIALNCRRRRLVGGFSCPEAEHFSGRREWRETMEGSKATVVLDGNGVVGSSSGSEAVPKAVCSRRRKSDMVEPLSQR